VIPSLLLLALVSIQAKAPLRSPFPVTCSPFENCPEAVGLWAYADPSEKIPTQCTTFLVGRDLAMTDRHCLPPGEQHARSPCRDVSLFFPAIGKHGADSARCREVVAISPSCDRIDQPDFALVRLDRSLNRTPLDIDRTGLSDLDTVRAWVAEPDWASLVARNQPSAEIRSVDCVVSRRTRVFGDADSRVDFTDPLSRKVPLASCPAWKGNSGAPALVREADGRWVVRALLDRSAPADALRQWVRKQGFPLLDTALGEFAYATNLDCVSWRGQPDPPPACHEDVSPQAVSREHQRWKHEVDSTIRCRVQSCLGTGMEGHVLQQGVWGPFQQAMGAGPGLPDAMVVPLPDCAPSKSDSEWTVPIWSMRFGFDRDLRWSFRMSLVDSLFRVRVHSRTIADGLRVCRFEGVFPSGIFGMRTDTLARCPDRVTSASR
jgi:hypothetical protein